MESSPTTFDVSVCSDTRHISDYLSRLATQGNPHPDLLGFFEHKRPQFIQFERDGNAIFWIGDHQSRAERGKLSYFFGSNWMRLCERSQMCGLGRANYSVRDRHEESPRDELADRNGESGSHGFDGHTSGNDTVVTHWEHDHCV